jgi:pyruvate,water dikinase
VLTEGRSVGHKIGSGCAKIVKTLEDMQHFNAGDVLVTDMTDPDWEPIMKRAAAIVTNRGGRTCHAAIIARELGIPAVVGCLNATQQIKDGMDVTVSCAEGDIGYIYKGLLKFEVNMANLANLPKLPVNLMMNIANPNQAFLMQQLPNAGVGLARLEFVINQMIGIHPKACIDFVNLPADLQQQISARSAGYTDPVTFYQEKLTEGIATLAAAFWPKPVIVRLSDFKSNEYANLLGGKIYEPHEENPMLGFRGACRYVSENFAACFALECAAINKVRNEHGLTNVEVMVPFVRTLGEAKQVIELLEKNGLKSGVNKLKIIMMCEIPANAILAEQFLKYFDGFSIGSNDLTQLTLGVDRDSGLVAGAFNEQDPAVIAMLELAITACKKHGKYVGICGQGPSDSKELAKWLLQHQISSISLTPDSILATWKFLADCAPFDPSTGSGQAAATNVASSG